VPAGALVIDAPATDGADPERARLERERAALERKLASVNSKLQE
jgi:hypothetical protein